MRTPIIQLQAQREQGQHPGLLLCRYLAEPVAGGGNSDEKRALIQSAIAAGRSQGLRDVYSLAFERWKASLTSHQTVTLATVPYTRLIVGLGQKGVIEAGLRLHHTYGVPIIPGSALKGIANHYCVEVWGKEDAKYAAEGDYHRLLFGTTEEGGCILFEDAWIDPGSLPNALRKDVMTPHHQQWQTNPEVAPTDFDSPIPVPFVSVAGRFLVAVAWQGPAHDEAETKKWTALAMELIKDALKEWGVGGKTSSGYGRLIDPDEKKRPPLPVTQAAPQDRLRDRGEQVRVKILGPAKRGFNVQEQGRPPGILVQGARPAGVDTASSEMVTVYIEKDDLQKPEYRWSKR